VPITVTVFLPSTQGGGASGICHSLNLNNEDKQIRALATPWSRHQLFYLHLDSGMRATA